MANEPSSTNDLRSGAVDTKRERTQKHKWALGLNTRVPDSKRPNHHPDRVYPSRIYITERIPRFDQSIRNADRNDVLNEMHAYGSGSDSSADEHISDPDADVGITYSYDKARGPGSGSRVFGEALVRAVEKYENVQTDQLVSAEYELLDGEGQSVVVPVKKVKVKKVNVEDEYEFV